MISRGFAAMMEEFAAFRSEMTVIIVSSKNYVFADLKNRL